MEHTRSRGHSFYEEDDANDCSDTTPNTSLRLSLDDLEFEEAEEQEGEAGGGREERRQRRSDVEQLRPQGSG